MAHGQGKLMCCHRPGWLPIPVTLLQYFLYNGWAWLQALGLKKDMSLVTDDMSQPIKLDNRSTLPPYTWPSDNAFPNDANFGYPTCDLSFVVEEMWAEFPYLRRIKDLPYPLKYKCKAGASDVKLKFGMYYGVPAHKECSLPVSTLGIIQGGIHSEGVHTIYAQEVKDTEGSFHWTTTKTCVWCNKSAMNHMHAHYQIVLVCPFCGMCSSHFYSSMREHMKKCKETYRDLLKGSDAETGLYEPCFCKGDTHLPKKGLVPPIPFTYKLEEGRVNTKTIKQLISEFHKRAEEEVTAACKAHLFHKRQNVQAPDDDSKKFSHAAEIDAEETPKKKWVKSTPSTAKSLPSAAVGRAPKGTGIDEIKGHDNDELDFNDDVGSEDAGGDPVQAPEPPKDEKPQDSGKPSDEACHPSGDNSARHPGGSHSDCKKPRGRSRSGSESRSPCGSCSFPPGNRVCSGDRVCDGDRSRNKDHRSDRGSYYPDDHDRSCPYYDMHHDDRFYNFDSRYYGWGYDR